MAAARMTAARNAIRTWHRNLISKSEFFKVYYRMNNKSILLPALAFICIAISPASVRAQDRAEIVTQARAKLDAKSWSAAENLYSKAIALDPKEWTAWTNRGYIRNEMQNYDGAIADCTSGMAALALLGTGSPHQPGGSPSVPLCPPGAGRHGSKFWAN